MKRRARAGLAAAAAALTLAACSAIESRPPRQQEASPLPEPPPWNSIDMIWLDTEVVLLEPSLEWFEPLV